MPGPTKSSPRPWNAFEFLVRRWHLVRFGSRAGDSSKVSDVFVFLALTLAVVLAAAVAVLVWGSGRDETPEADEEP
jgi:hypothetical protein